MDVIKIGYIIASSEVMLGGKKIGDLYREEPDNPNDSGRRAFSGEESQEYADEPKSFSMCNANTVIEKFSEIASLLATEYPITFERDADSGDYAEVGNEADDAELSVISLGVQAGDPQADAAVAPHYKTLRALLASHCSKSYGDAIHEFSPVLRIDGAIWHLGKRGYGNVRISKKAKTATFDVFMPIDAWRGKDAATMRRSIAADFTEGFKAVIHRTTKDRLDVDGARLLADVDSALKDFVTE